MHFGVSTIFWITQVLKLILVVFQIYAFVDCATRKAAAFPASDKLTKPGWLVILGLAVLLTYFFPPWFGILGIAGVIASMVYVVDVRPAVRQPGSRW